MQSRDIRDICSFSVGGLLVGAMFQLVNIAWKKRVGLKLSSVETESLHLDGPLNALFLELEESIKQVEEVEFLRAVDSADKLVFIRMLLQNKTVTPKVEDRVDAYLEYQRCENALGAIRKKVEEMYPPKAAISFLKTLDRVSELLSSHLSAVMMFTGEI